MNATDKYEQARPLIRNGDIALFRGGSIISKAIQWGDAVKENGKMVKAYYNHAGLIFTKGTRNFIVDSNAKGVRPDFLSLRMAEYLDFCIIRPMGFSDGVINDAVEKALARGEVGTKYDFSLLPKIAIYRRFGWNIKKLGKEDRDICSEFTGKKYGAEFLGIKSYSQEATGHDWITPQDHIRFLSDQTSLMFDTRGK